MKYWIFDGQDAQGPYSEEELRRQPGFSPETLICPDGAASADQWKAARLLLAAKPASAAPEPPSPMRADDARPMARPQAQGPMGQPRPQPRTEVKPQPAPELKPSPDSEIKPGVAGESPEAIRLRLAQALPARRVEPIPEPLPPEPEPSTDRSALIKKAGMAAAALALLAGGILGGKAMLKKRAPAVDTGVGTPVTAPGLTAPETASSFDPGASGGVDEVLAFARQFPLQSKPRARPTDPADVLAPKSWRPAQTLGQLYDQLALEALAQEAAASVERQGKSLAEGDREIRRSAQLWNRRAARFLEKAAPQWSAELTGSRWTVTVRLPTRSAEPARRFDADPAARTLKPVDLLSWFDLDPKEASSWGGKYLRLSEDPQQPEGSGPQTPTYQGPGAVARKSTATKTPPERNDGAPIKPKGETGLIDEEEYTDPLEAVQPAKPAPAPKPVARPAPAPSAKPSPRRADSKPRDDRPDDETVIDTIFTDNEKPARQAEPLASPPSRPALPGSDGRPLPPPSKKASPDPEAPGPDDGKRQSVTDMSVDELQKYLSRDKK